MGKLTCPVLVQKAWQVPHRGPLLWPKAGRVVEQPIPQLPHRVEAGVAAGGECGGGGGEIVMVVGLW